MRHRGNLFQVTQQARSKSRGSHPSILTPETMTSTSPQGCLSRRRAGVTVGYTGENGTAGPAGRWFLPQCSDLSENKQETQRLSCDNRSGKWPNYNQGLNKAEHLVTSCNRSEQFQYSLKSVISRTDPHLCFAWGNSPWGRTGMIDREK